MQKNIEKIIYQLTLTDLKKFLDIKWKNRSEIVTIPEGNLFNRFVSKSVLSVILETTRLPETIDLPIVSCMQILNNKIISRECNNSNQIKELFPGGKTLEKGTVLIFLINLLFTEYCRQ